MTHDNPYDEREASAEREELRQRRAEETEEAENEYRQLGAAYWNNDDAYEPNDREDVE